VVTHAYQIDVDNARMRRLKDLDPEARGIEFDRLRKEYPIRREFWQYQVKGDPEIVHTARALGFK
jgi:erythronate-4-phosphate dehydrogenase